MAFRVSAALIAGLFGIALGQAPAIASDLDQAFVVGAGVATNLPRWTAVASRVAIEDASPAGLACATRPSAGDARCRFLAWQAALEQMRGDAPIAQLDQVHRIVNQLPYVPDSVNWGEADKWETPREMFERGGDCEDFALTKYFALRSLGFDDAAMRIAVVWDAVDREQHAVLLVRVGGTLWLLDNKMAGVEPAAAYVDRYRLIYSVNAGGATLATAPARADAPGAMRWTGNGRALVLQIDARPRRALSASR